MNRSLRSGLIALSAAALMATAPSVSQAQITRQISYQGLLTNPAGLPITDDTYGLVLRLYDAPTGGNLVWEETQQTTVVKGLFNVYLGSVVPLTGVDFFNTQLFLETAIQGQPPFPRTRLAVVPYAIRAERADKAGGLDDDATGVVRSLNGGQGDLVINGRNGIAVQRSGDTIHIESTVTFNGIQNLSSPQNTIDITNPNGPNTQIDVRDGAITTEKLANGAVTNPKLGDGSVTTTKVVDGAITLQKLAPGIIPTTLPPSGPASGDLTGTYPGPIIAPNAVTSAKIADGAVGNADLADNAVTTVKIQDGTVTSSKLTNTGVTAGTYGNTTNIPQVTVDEKGRVTGVVNIPLTNFPWVVPAGGDLTGTYPNPLIANNAVTTPKILDGNVTTPKLADGAVTTPKIADNSVTSAKIQDGTIQAADLAPGLIPTTLPPSGPAGGELTGSYPNPLIANNAVTSAKIQDGGVTNVDLGANSVTTDKIQDGTVQSVDLAPGVIPTTLPPSGTAGGVLSGTYPNPNIATSAGNAVLTAINDGATTMRIADNRLNTTGVAAGTYGNGTTGLVPRITVDQYGRITSAAQEQIQSARPTGNAGGDLQGTYPDPLLNPTAAAGGRMVTALSNAFIGGNPAINTAQNLVMLDAANRFPARDGSLITNLNANNITTGVLSVQRGGTGSGATLNNNRMVWTTGNAIVEAPPLAAGQMFIGTGVTSAPAQGTIVAGAGVNVNYTSPNIVISSTDARVAAGTANDQTLRWNAGTSQWVNNTNVLASSAGDVTMNGNLVVNGTSSLRGNTEIGTNASTVNSFGTGSGASNTIGHATGVSTTNIRGTVNINHNVDANTTIGMQSGNTSSIVLAAGVNGNIVMENVDVETPFAFLSLNPSRQVRTALASSMALEGIQWQDGAFRLGGQTALINPLVSTRFVNLNNQQLNFTGVNGTRTLINLNGAFPTVNVTATTNINTTGTDLTTIGSPTSKTIIGGELDPRGVIRNQTGAVVVLDEFEQYGQAQINYGTEANTFIGNPTGAGQQQNVEIAVGGGVGPNGDLKLINIKTEIPLDDLLWIRGDNKVRRIPFADLDDEGVHFQNGRFRLGVAASDATPLRTNSYDENRFVNLDAFELAFTNGSEGADGVTFFHLDGATSNVGFGENATATHLVTINGTPQTTGTATPNLRIRHLGGDAFNPTPDPVQDYVDVNTNGLLVGDANGDIVKWDESDVIGAFAWLRTGNEINDGNNIFGTLNPIDIDVRTNNVNAMTISSLDQTVGIGAAPATGLARLNVDASALGVTSVGIIANAQDVGMQIGTTGTPVNGIEVDATGVGLLVRRNSVTGPAVGVSIDNSNLGLQVTSAVTALDVEGSSFFNGDVRVFDDGTNPAGSDNVTNVLLRGGSGQGTSAYLRVEDNGLNTVFDVSTNAGVNEFEFGGAHAAGNARLNLYGNGGGGLARVEIVPSMNNTNFYQFPQIEATGQVVMSDGQGLVGDILRSNGPNNRAIWTSAVAEQGVSYMVEGGNRLFRMGGLANTDVPFLANRFVNLNTFNLSFTANGGANTPLQIVGGANSGLNLVANGTGTINATGTTNINTTGSAVTTIGSIATGGAVNVRSSGVNPITVDVGVNTNNLVLNNIATAADVDDFLRITPGPGNAVRRIPGASIANEGLEFENGAFRLGATPDHTINPIVNDRFVGFNGGQLTFATNTGERLMRFTTAGDVEVNGTGNGLTTIGSAAAGAITAQSASTIGLTAGTTASIASVTTNINTVSGDVNVGNAGGTNTILGTTNADGNTTINDGVSTFTTNIGTGGNTGLVTIGSPTNAVSILGATNTVTGTTNINTTLASNTNIGHNAGGVVTVHGNGVNGMRIFGNGAAAGDNTIVIDPGEFSAAPGDEYDLVINNIQSLSPIQDVLWITAANEVRRAAFTSIANEGVQFESGAFRLGHSTNGGNPIVTNRFVRIDAPGSLTFNTAGNTMISLANTGNVGISTTGAGTTTIGSATAGTIGLQTNSTLTTSSAGNTVIDVTGAGSDLDVNVTDAITLDAATITSTGTTSVSSVAPTVNVNATGTGVTNIGSATAGTIAINAGGAGNDVTINANDDVNVTAVDVNILGTTSTSINTTGTGTTAVGSATAGAITAQSASTIGLTAGTTASIASTTTNINTGSGAVNIGNAAGANTILGATNTITGTTNVNTTGTAATSIGSTATGGAVNVSSAGDITVAVTGGGNDLILNGISTAAVTDDFLRIVPGTNEVRRQTGANMANQGLMFEGGEFRLGHSTNGVNPIVTSRFVRIDAPGSLTFNTAGNTMISLANTGNVGISTTGAGTTTIGSATAGTIGLQTNSTLTTSSAGNTVIDVTGAGSDLDVNVTDAITLDAATITSTGTTSVSSVAPTVNVNATGTGVTNIGSATAGTIAINAGGAGNDVTINANDDVNVTAVDVNILGTTSTSINTTGAGTTAIGSATAGAITAQSVSTIGLTAGTTASIASTTTNINTVSGAVNIGSNTSTAAVTIGSNQDVIVDLGAAATTDLIVNNMKTGAQGDDRVVIDGSNQVRRVPNIGQITFARKAGDEIRAAALGALANDASLVVPVVNGQTYEFEVYIQYSGDDITFSQLDISVTGPAGAGDMSYGVVTSGMGLAPANVDGSGTVIENLGVDGTAPTNRLTVLLKGMIVANASGNVQVQWGDNDPVNPSNTTVHRNSYLKLTRVQ